MPVEEIERLIGERRAARERRDFAAADAHSPRAGRSRRPAGGQSGGDALEEEVGLAGAPGTGA